MVRKNQTTKRFEAVGASEKNKTEMILGIDCEEQLKSIELQVESLLHYQDANQVELLLDSELGAALTESINFVAAKAATYFDTSRIDEYFLSAKQRKKANKENIPELGGFIDRPILRHKSSKAKEKEPEVFFYQDLNGANIYLHYLCQEFINQYVGLANAPEFIKVSLA